MEVGRQLIRYDIYLVIDDDGMDSGGFLDEVSQILDIF